MIKEAVPIFLISTIAFASIHGGVTGEVTIKIDASHAQIKTNGLVREGDRVILFSQECRGPKVPLCRKTRVGVGVVSRVLNENASEVHVEGQAPLKEGLLIERE